MFVPYMPPKKLEIKWNKHVHAWPWLELHAWILFLTLRTSSASTAMPFSKHIYEPRSSCRYRHDMIGRCSLFCPCSPRLQMWPGASNKFLSSHGGPPYGKSSASWDGFCKEASLPSSIGPQAIHRMQNAACKARPSAQPLIVALPLPDSYSSNSRQHPKTNNTPNAFLHASSCRLCPIALKCTIAPSTML